MLFPSLLLEWGRGGGNGIEEDRQAFVAFTVMPCFDSHMLSKGEAHEILSLFFFNFQACRQEKKKNATLDEHPSCTVRELLDRKRSFLISQLALRPHLTTKKRREKKKTSFFFFPARPYFELFLISPLSPLSPASLLFFFFTSLLLRSSLHLLPFASVFTHRLIKTIIAVASTGFSFFFFF